MTDGPDRRPPPADLAALAELDAGLPDDAQAARRRAAAGPEAAAVLDALAATRAELAALPAPDVPPAVAARWAAALAAEAEPGGGANDSPKHHVEPCGGRERAPRWVGRARRRLLMAAACAAVVAGGLGALLHPRPSDPPAATRVELVALGRETIGTMDVGELADSSRRAACLRAVAPEAAGEALLGGRRVVLDGRPGVLLVLATGTRGGLRILTVDPACGPGGGTLLAQLVVG